jgi:hypothetical protein
LPAEIFTTVVSCAIVSAEPTVLFGVDLVLPSFSSSPSTLTYKIFVVFKVSLTLVRFSPSPKNAVALTSPVSPNIVTAAPTDAIPVTSTLSDKFVNPNVVIPDEVISFNELKPDTFKPSLPIVVKPSVVIPETSKEVTLATPPMTSHLPILQNLHVFLKDQ